MTRQKEAELLEEFRKEAVAGGLVVLRKIKSEYAKRVGHAVPDSTISRVLARHDWRLVKPRPKHPDGDPAARDAFKKNCMRGWLPPGLPSPI
jgi:transposase